MQFSKCRFSERCYCFPLTLLGIRPFPCPHCDKIFRTSGHRKTHIASHFKSLQQKKHKFPRKTNKAKVSKSNLPLPDIHLQEPILITDYGKLVMLTGTCTFDSCCSSFCFVYVQNKKKYFSHGSPHVTCSRIT